MKPISIFEVLGHVVEDDEWPVREALERNVQLRIQRGQLGFELLGIRPILRRVFRVHLPKLLREIARDDDRVHGIKPEMHIHGAVVVLVLIGPFAFGARVLHRAAASADRKQRETRRLVERDHTRLFRNCSDCLVEKNLEVFGNADDRVRAADRLRVGRLQRV